MSTIKFKNVARDFENEYLFKGYTKSGRMKLQEIVGSSPQGFTYGKNRMTRKEGKTHYVSEGGSPFNTYYYEED